MALDTKAIAKLRESLQEYEKRRDTIIQLGRELITLSKKVIYGVHRGEKVAIEELHKKKQEIQKLATQKDLLHEPSYKVALQEYVEAVVYFEYVHHTKFPTHLQLKVSAHEYVLGICDLTGELVRKAVYLAGKGNYEEVFAIRDLIDEIYGSFLTMDFRENEMRRKFDSVKYDLRKLEDLCLTISMKK